MIRLLKLTVLIAAISILVGCATPANYQAMTIKPTSIKQQNPKLKKAILVTNVFGGKKTNPALASKVSSEDFKKALENSLSMYGYLANSPNQAKYKLDVNLSKISEPAIGLDFNIESVVVYGMSGNGIDKEYIVKAHGKAGLSDAFYGITRLKIAKEKSIQENIKKFLEQLNSV